MLLGYPCSDILPGGAVISYIFYLRIESIDFSHPFVSCCIHDTVLPSECLFLSVCLFSLTSSGENILRSLGLAFLLKGATKVKKLHRIVLTCFRGQGKSKTDNGV